MFVFSSFSDSFVDNNALPIRYLLHRLFCTATNETVTKASKVLYVSQQEIFFGLQLLNWCQKINKMYNMMILQKLVVKQGRVAVTSITNILISSFDMMRAHCWLEKYVVRAFCLFVLVLFSPIFHYSGSFT